MGKGFTVEFSAAFIHMAILTAMTATANVAVAQALESQEPASGRNVSNGVYAIGLWGDLPYSTVQAQMVYGT